MIGVGYEWWVSEQWSFGILGRVVGIVAAQEDDTGVRWVHGIGSSPSVLLTATFSSHRRFAGPVARRDGTFTARFNVRITKCTNLVVRAIGGRGSRAILRTKVACTKAQGPSEGPPRETKTAKG